MNKTRQEFAAALQRNLRLRRTTGANVIYAAIEDNLEEWALVLEQTMDEEGI